MPPNVRDCDGEATIRQLRPDEVVSTGLIRWLVPACHIETIDYRRHAGQQPLLNRPRDSKIALQPGSVLRFPQSFNDMEPNFVCHRSGSESSDQQKGYIGRETAIDEERISCRYLREQEKDIKRGYGVTRGREGSCQTREARV